MVAGMVPVSSGHWAKGVVQPGKIFQGVSHTQFVTEAHRTNKNTHTLIHKDTLQKVTNQTVMILDCGRELEYQERTYIRIWRMSPGQDSNPGPPCCKALALPTN